MPPLHTKTVIMACHYGAAEQRRALQQPGERGDVPLPLFTSQLITILADARQTAWRQPSHVCVHETLGEGWLGGDKGVCVCVCQTKGRKAGSGDCKSALGGPFPSALLYMCRFGHFRQVFLTKKKKIFTLKKKKCCQDLDMTVRLLCLGD